MIDQEHEIAYLSTPSLTREEMIKQLVDRDMDNIFSDYKDLERFVAHALIKGIKGWENETDEVVNDVYIDIFGEE